MSAAPSPQATPGAVAEAFVAALAAADWAAATALLQPSATWSVDGAETLSGRDSILGHLAARSPSLTVAGPLRITRGSEVAWPATETCPGDDPAAAAGPLGRVDIIDVGNDGLIGSWATIRAAAPSPRVEARSAALLAYVERVGRADAEGALMLFADECRVEDPVGTPAHEGRAAVDAFYRSGVAAITSTTLLGPPVVGDGRLGAVPFRVSLQLSDRAIALDVVDVMSFDEDDRFTSMRAFWGRKNHISL